jgi:hypothetical protein
MGDRPDAVGRRVAEDRSAGSGPVPLPDAFLEERRDDFDKGLVVPDAQEVFDLSARLPDVAHPRLEKHPSLCPMFRPDSRPLDVVLEARPVSELLLREQRPASLPLDALSDGQLSKAAQSELHRGVVARRSVQRLLALPSSPLEHAKEHRAPQALRAMAQLPVSARSQPEPQPGQGVVKSLLWPPQSSPLRPPLPPQPDQGNASALARRARYQSSSSASSSL